MKTKDGSIIIAIEEIIQDESVLREIAKSALFDDLLLKAITDIAISGQVQWSEDEAPWWVCSSGYSARFERVRSAVASLANDAAASLVKDLSGIRDRLEKENRIFQHRAWRAENIIYRYRSNLMSAAVMDERDKNEIDQCCRVSAHAQESDL